MSETPKEIWVIFDELDEPHVFNNEEKALKTYNRWLRWSPWLNVSEPIYYMLGGKCKGALDGL